MRGLAVLIVAVALLSVTVSVAGLFSAGGEGPRHYTTVRGGDVELYGRGIYRNDTAFKAPVFRGTDAVFLAVAVPALLAALIRSRRRGLRGQLLLAGLLGCFLYNGASMTFGAAFSSLYLVYSALFATSFWALAALLRRIDHSRLQSRVDSDRPRKGTAVFLFIASLSPLVWLIDIVTGLATGQAPSTLGSYSTDVTTALDVGIITPASILAGVLILKRRGLGYVLADLLLVLLVLIGLVVLGQTVMQIIDGIALSPALLVAYVLPFVALSAIAVFFLRGLLAPLRD
jgi:hypothetical protein